MLQVVTALKSYTLKGADGTIGTISDLLFDDRAWTVRWLVVDTGGWFTDREILVRPSTVTAADHEKLELYVDLRKADIKDSPDSISDMPVSQQQERRLYSRYGWDPLLGTPGAMAGAFSPPPFFSDVSLQEADRAEPGAEHGNPYLRSVTAVIGYHAQAMDGAIGHVENFLIDDERWHLNYVIIDTKDWWFGKRVLLSVHVVQDIRWSDRQIQLNVNRDQVKASPPWNALNVFEEAYAMQLHEHYGWPSYDAV
jgi:hypothetical protein